MKCDRISIYGWKLEISKNKGKPHILITFVDKDKVLPATYFPASYVILGTGICGGTIKSNIELKSEPYLGGTSYDVEFEFVCDKCGHNFSGERGLPDTLDKLNKFITERL